MKNGVTATVLIITIVIMFIIITISAAVGTSSVNTAIYEEFQSKILRVRDNVNMYVLSENQIPTNGTILSKTGLDQKLLISIANNGDEQNNLKVLDMSKINVIGVNIGYGTMEDKDVFLVSDKTNNIYYYKGFEYKGKTYYNSFDFSD